MELAWVAKWQTPRRGGAFGEAWVRAGRDIELLVRGWSLAELGQAASGGKITIETDRRMNLDDLQSAVGVYVLLGSGEYMYKGSARNLRKRVFDHLQGRVARTRARRPLKLIHVEYVTDYTEARRRENWLKSGQGRKWLQERYAWVAKWSRRSGEVGTSNFPPKADPPPAGKS